MSGRLKHRPPASPLSKKTRAHIAVVTSRSDDENHSVMVVGFSIEIGTYRAAQMCAIRINKEVDGHVDAAVSEERERCAKVVETYSNSERATDLILAEIRNPKGAR